MPRAARARPHATRGDNRGQGGGDVAVGEAGKRASNKTATGGAVPRHPVLTSKPVSPLRDLTTNKGLPPRIAQRLPSRAAWATAESIPQVPGNGASVAPAAPCSRASGSWQHGVGVGLLIEHGWCALRSPPNGGVQTSNPDTYAELCHFLPFATGHPLVLGVRLRFRGNPQKSAKVSGCPVTSPLHGL
jgi:hypothetical protein